MFSEFLDKNKHIFWGKIRSDVWKREGDVNVFTNVWNKWTTFMLLTLFWEKIYGNFHQVWDDAVCIKTALENAKIQFFRANSFRSPEKSFSHANDKDCWHDKIKYHLDSRWNLVACQDSYCTWDYVCEERVTHDETHGKHGNLRTMFQLRFEINVSML